MQKSKSKRKKGWSLYLATSGTTGGVRQLPCNRVIIASFFVFLFLGILGLGRCLYFASTYGVAKLKMYYALKENDYLQSKVLFFSKFVKEERNRIDRLMAFEDNTRLKFGMDQISTDLRMVGVGGRPANSEMILTSYDDPILQKADSIKEGIQTLLRQIQLEDTTFGKMAELVDKQYNVWQQRPAVMPVWGRLTSTFGYRVHPFTGYTVFHEGLDISNEMGTPIRATANGVVSFVGYKEYFGNVVMISHPASGFKTIFAHLKKAAILEGQAVKRGDLIGYLGTTGRSTGPHLHYEIHRLNDIVNPADYVLPSDSMID